MGRETEGNGWKSGCHIASRRGFTLMEMLVVIAIMSVLSGIVIGSLSTLRSTSLSVHTREFADFVNLCRSDAIARHTAIRVAMVDRSSTDPDEEFRKYSAFEWNPQTREFQQYRSWQSLPLDLVFAERFPEFVKKSTYYSNDPSSVRGDSVMSLPGNTMDETFPQLEATYRMRFFEFSPSGRASAPTGNHRNLVLVILPEEGETQVDVPNWSQFNIDTLTGRIRIYRP